MIQFLKQLFSSNPTLYVPDAQRSISVIGAPGTGKTFSVIDPLVASAIRQGFPTMLYDFKYPAQTKRICALALKMGYEVNIFSPGFPESKTCNPLDLLRDEEDAVAAGQLTKTITRNFYFGSGNGGDNKFFEDAGETLLEGILLLTKAVGSLAGDNKYCDLMMAQAILSLTELPKRLELASKNKLKVWTSRPLSQIISVKDSSKTTAAIIGVTQRMFQRFLKRDFIGAFCGETNLPLDLDGKKLIIFGLDRKNRDIISPLLAAIMNIIVARNVSRVIPRKDPLVVALDELPTIIFPDLVKLLNEAREDGFVGILGFQNIAQLEKTYSEKDAKAILGATGTKFIFNPQEDRSAELFSRLLGDTEIKLKTKSRTYGKVKSRTINENFQTRRLLEPAQILKMGTGKAIVINPNYRSGSDSYVPLIEQIKIPANDIAAMNWSENKWSVICQYFTEENKQHLVVCQF